MILKQLNQEYVESRMNSSYIKCSHVYASIIFGLELSLESRCLSGRNIVVLNLGNLDRVWRSPIFFLITLFFFF